MNKLQWFNEKGQQSVHASLAKIANTLRRDVIGMTTKAGSGHPTSCLSCAEIMSTLFFHEMHWNPCDPQAHDVDEFILSKGHAAPILWATLYRAGAIEEELDTLRRIDSTLEGHPTPRNRFVKVATGSLGQGLSAANGVAFAQKMDGVDRRVFCLLGDGECSEGAIWEAAQFASEKSLDNVVAIVDVNGLQQSDRAPSLGDTAVLAKRFDAFGWRTMEIDGHDISALTEALTNTRQGGPTAILARTVKGKGISFLERKEGLHGKPVNPDELESALAEIPDHPVDITRPPCGDSPTQRKRTTHPPAAIPVNYRPGDQVATRAAFGQALQMLGETIPELVVLDGDVKNSTCTELFKNAHPERFIEANIAEQNMIGTALGLAVSNKLPCASTFSAFLTRAHDFIRMAGYSRPEHLVLCGSHAGVSIGQDGPSQMGLEDLAMFRAIEGATILYPCDALSAVRLTEQAMQTKGIVYLRTTRSKTPVIYDKDEAFPVGGSKTLVCSLRDALTVVACGITVHEALQAQQKLLKHNIHIRVIDAYSINPLDVATLQQAARETGKLLVVEDHRMAGGLGDAVSSEVGRLADVYRMGVTRPPQSGAPDELLERHHLSHNQIVLKVLAIVEQGHAPLNQ
ncbi:MAG: transketolase [Pseudomonadota bacterium]